MSTIYNMDYPNAIDARMRKIKADDILQLNYLTGEYERVGNGGSGTDLPPYLRTDYINMNNKTVIKENNITLRTLGEGEGDTLTTSLTAQKINQLDSILKAINYDFGQNKTSINGGVYLPELSSFTGDSLMVYDSNSKLIGYDNTQPKKWNDTSALFDKTSKIPVTLNSTNQVINEQITLPVGSKYTPTSSALSISTPILSINSTNSTLTKFGVNELWPMLSSIVAPNLKIGTNTSFSMINKASIDKWNAGSGGTVPYYVQSEMINMENNESIKLINGVGDSSVVFPGTQDPATESMTILGDSITCQITKNSDISKKRSATYYSGGIGLSDENGNSFNLNLDNLIKFWKPKITSINRTSLAELIEKTLTTGEKIYESSSSSATIKIDIIAGQRRVLRFPNILLNTSYAIKINDTTDNGSSATWPVISFSMGPVITGRSDTGYENVYQGSAVSSNRLLSTSITKLTIGSKMDSYHIFKIITADGSKTVNDIYIHLDCISLNGNAANASDSNFSIYPPPLMMSTMNVEEEEDDGEFTLVSDDEEEEEILYYNLNETNNILCYDLKNDSGIYEWNREKMTGFKQLTNDQAILLNFDDIPIMIKSNNTETNLFLYIEGLSSNSIYSAEYFGTSDVTIDAFKSMAYLGDIVKNVVRINVKRKTDESTLKFITGSIKIKVLTSDVSDQVNFIDVK